MILNGGGVRFLGYKLPVAKGEVVCVPKGGQYGPWAVYGKTGRKRRCMRRTDPISFRIKAEIKQALERLAKEDRRSLSQYIELALEAHIEALRGKKEAMVKEREGTLRPPLKH